MHHVTYNDISDAVSALEISYSVVPYSLCRLIQNPSFTLSAEPYYSLNDKECSRIVGTCNGLICLTGDSERCAFQYFRLWNPATRKISEKFGFHCLYENLADRPFPFLDGIIKFSFGCDNSTGTYKVVALGSDQLKQRSIVRILNFGDNFWREIESLPVVPLMLCSTLNWMAIHHDFHSNLKYASIKQFVIVSLNLGTEKYNQYRLPCDFDEVPPTPPIVGVLGGFLCCSYFYKETDFVIWQMKELGFEDSWTQFLKISYQNLQIDYDYFSYEGDEETEYHFQLVPLLLSEDADTLVLTSRHESDSILYNWRDNRVERTKITTSSAITDPRNSNSICWCSAKVYVESLVSNF